MPRHRRAQQKHAHTRGFLPELARSERLTARNLPPNNSRGCGQPTAQAAPHIQPPQNMAPAPASAPSSAGSAPRRPLLRRALPALLVLTLAVLPAVLPPAVTAQPAPQRTDLVARVVFSLLGYARWPVERDPVRLCVDNASRYAARLMEGGTLSNGRSVQTRQVDVLADMLQPTCDALYVGVMNDARRKRLSAEVTGRPVLVIAEEDFECEVGSMFCLNIRDQQVSFRVNLDTLARSGVHVHPAVLQLGRRRGAPS